MIKSITPLFSTLFLLGVSFLILSIPTWLTYLMLISTAVIYTTYFLFKSSNTLSLIWHFLTEFIGFCLLVALFVGTIVIMNGLIYK